MHKNNNRKIRRWTENGLVSIFVVTVFMALLTLIVIGFTRIMNRELRQALDRELATQASFAVESGMNDARAAISLALKNGTLDSLNTNGKCMDLTTLKKPFVLNGSISGAFNNDTNDTLIRYTCVIIQTKPKELTDIIPRGQSKTFLLSASTPIDKIYVGWQNKKDSATPQPLGPTYQLPQEASVSDDQTGLLRATLYPIENARSASESSDVKNDAINSVARTYFMYPNASLTATNSGNLSNQTYNAENGIFVPGNCNIANKNNSGYLPFVQAIGRYCNARISNLTPASPPPPPPIIPPPAENLAIKGNVEWHSGFPLMTVVITARQAGLPDLQLFNHTYQPGEFGASKEPCGSPNDGNQHSAAINSTFSLPLSYTNPDIDVFWSGDGYQLNVGDNDVIIDSINFTAQGKPRSLNPVSYVATKNDIPPGYVLTNPPYMACWEGTVKFRAPYNIVTPPPPTPLPAPAFYYLRLTALYQDLNVYVIGADSSNNALNLTGSQVELDVTAQGNDILKREHASVSIQEQSNLIYPQYALQSMDTICKRLRLPKIAAGTFSSSYGDAFYNDPNETGAASVAAACSVNGLIPPG
jgi:hypothetical protein